MTTMTRHSVAENAWTEVAANTVRCFLQLQNGPAALIHMAASAPAADSIVGIVVEGGEVPELSLDQLESGDRVYARGLGGEVHLLAAVAAEAPA